MYRNYRLIFRFSRIQFSTNPQKQPTKAEIPSLTNDINTRLLKVAIIGVPNAGKSTLINNLMDRKVCATSSKVHTTRSKSMAVFTKSDSQIVFLDTPGLVSPKERDKFKLERSFVKDSKSSLQNADIIGVIQDVSNIWTRDKLDIKVIKLLEEFSQKPSFLVLNKIDTLKSKRKLLDITRLITENSLDGRAIPNIKPIHYSDKEIRGWKHFQEIFMVSALTGNGLSEIENFLVSRAKPAKWMFPENIFSDQTAEEIIVNSVKAKLLDFLPQEIPYQLKPELEFFTIDSKGNVTTVVLVHCPSERISKLVAGVSDGKLKQITESLQHDLQDTFQSFVRVKLVLQSSEQKI